MDSMENKSDSCGNSETSRIESEMLKFIEEVNSADFDTDGVVETFHEKVQQILEELHHLDLSQTMRMKDTYQKFSEVIRKYHLWY